MGYFVQGDNFEKVGGSAEEQVWKLVKKCFNHQDVLGYSRYPYFQKHGEKRKEPDILLFDKEEGLIILEVKGFFAEGISRVEPNLWHLVDGYEKTVNPIAQVEDYAFNLKNKLEGERALRGKVRVRGIVVLPFISKVEWESLGFMAITKHYPILFKEDLAPSSFLETIYAIPPLETGYSLSEENYKLGCAILGYEQIHLEDSNEFSHLLPGTKGRIISDLKSMIYDLDNQQESIGKSIPPGPQRIRGIAGSGKTLLLCQKAAYIHLKHPEWRIAFVFATQSLYELVTSLINRYLLAFSGGEVGYVEGGNIEILHAWGRKDKLGFYREVALRHRISPLNVNDVKKSLKKSYLPQSVSVNYICKNLLETCSGIVEQLYDVILIDEGQDLISTPDLLYDGHHPFYYLAYQSLKYHEVDNKKVRRLIWAYDELQSLDTMVIPSWKTIIGDDDSMGDGPTYKGGIKKSEIMRKCYRVPNEILPIAHGLGMGWFREAGMLTGYTQKQYWEDIGYEVISGDFRKNNSKILLKRQEKYSVNPIQKLYNGSLITFNTYQSHYDLAQELAKSIENDITTQGLKSDRDILIINLKDKGFPTDVMNALNGRGINYYMPSMPNVNLMKSDKTCPEVFWKEGGVTISKVMRAKGNEAPMVYVIGLEEIAEHENEPSYRNKLFVSLTRTKCFVTLMGVGNWTLYDEINTAIQSQGTYEINYKKPTHIVDDYDVLSKEG